MEQCFGYETALYDFMTSMPGLNCSPQLLVLGSVTMGYGYYKVCSNDDPGLILKKLIEIYILVTECQVSAALVSQGADPGFLERGFGGSLC